MPKFKNISLGEYFSLSLPGCYLQSFSPNGFYRFCNGHSTYGFGVCFKRIRACHHSLASLGAIWFLLWIATTHWSLINLGPLEAKWSSRWFSRSDASVGRSFMDFWSGWNRRFDNHIRCFLRNQWISDCFGQESRKTVWSENSSSRLFRLKTTNEDHVGPSSCRTTCCGTTPLRLGRRCRRQAGGYVHQPWDGFRADHSDEMKVSINSSITQP